MVARWFRPWARSGSLGAPGLVVRTQVDGLGVVVTPGCESVIASALAWTPVYLDLHPAHLGDTGRKKERWPRGLFFYQRLQSRQNINSPLEGKIFEPLLRIFEGIKPLLVQTHMP